MGTLYYSLQLLVFFIMLSIFIRRYRTKILRVDLFGLVFYSGMFFCLAVNFNIFNMLGIPIPAGLRIYQVVPSVLLALIFSFLATFILRQLSEVTKKKVNILWRLPVIAALIPPLVPEFSWTVYIYIAALLIPTIYLFWHKRMGAKSMATIVLTFGIASYSYNHNMHLFHIFILIHIVTLCQMFNRNIRNVVIHNEG